MISILIPTFNNLEYLKLCLKSLEQNSSKKYEIILHVNDGSDGTLEFAKSKDLKFSYSKKNLGLCTSINSAAKLSNSLVVTPSYSPSITFIATFSGVTNGFRP